ncbi:uncharacterized protein LOC122668686 [Telopea speciosissima]|uniref:uncharacterized protein LOC122668686 n=1 Tax=Telopea speciosissima TaxID=54955 RepID=UPI001CC6EEB9|nr:uncharacterized protein LOC122668686 [Telopea speciosissima]
MSLSNSLLAYIHVLSGNNYKRWVEDLEINLGLLDLDVALQESKPADLTDASTNAERKLIPESLRDSVEVKDTATEFLTEIKVIFEVSQKVEKGDLMNQITSAVFDGTESVREHLLKMANKLRDLGMPIEEELLVHLALKSLPDVYANIKSVNTAQKDK